MNNFLNNKPLLLSVAVNVFLAAFVLGRLSAPAVQLTPALVAPSGMDEGPRHGPPGPPPGGGAAGAALQMFRPEDLFTRSEMDQNMAELQPDFIRIKQLRQDLAVKLAAGAVSEDALLADFAGVDQAMADMQATMQQKAAKKIMALSPEERSRLALRLMTSHRPPPPPPRDGRGGPDGPGGPGGPGGWRPGPPGEGPPDRPLPGEGPQNGSLPGEGQPSQPLPGEGNPGTNAPPTPQ